MIDRLRFREHRTVRQIAAVIGRSPSTVSRELRCNLWNPSNENESYRPYRPARLKTGAWTGGPYYCVPAAQRLAGKRRPPHPGACVRRAAARGQDRPHMGQRQRVRAPPVGRRVDGHAGLSTRSVIVWSHGGRIAIGRVPGRAVSACRASRRSHDGQKSRQFRRAG
ncbi:helix-turn-helix domain-containing protein [Bifidobacterium thermophilum]|nr:helix-turn-helix domain-containing protein [Bifidobacterium thermophilum]MDW8485584.1 helix-turn-helix domain-containing protein [Bifidobacterium thermophilum]